MNGLSRFRAVQPDRVGVGLGEECDILLLGIAGMQCPFAVCATLLQEGGKPTKEAC